MQTSAKSSECYHAIIKRKVSVLVVNFDTAVQLSFNLNSYIDDIFLKSQFDQRVHTGCWKAERHMISCASVCQTMCQNCSRL